MVIEAQPRSRLAEIQKQDASWQVFIARRQAWIDWLPTATFNRPDPDLTEATKVHARRMAEVTLPANIARAQQQREALRAERIVYMQEHAPELIAQAQEFDVQIQQEQTIVGRLTRDLKRGFTTQEIVDDHRTRLQVMLDQKETDADLQAGFELLSQQATTEKIAESDKTAPAKEPPFPVSIPLLFPRLQQIAFSDAKAAQDPQNLVQKKAREALLAKAEERTPQQVQLFEDIAFMNEFTSSIAYQSVYSPQDLHTLVEGVRQSIGQSPTFPLDFQKRVLNIFTECATDFREKVPGLEEAQVKLNVPGTEGLSTEEFVGFANLASKAIRSLKESAKNKYLVGVIRQELSVIHQAAFDIAALDLYRQNNKPAWQLNLESFKANKEIITAWHLEVEAIIDQLRGVEQTASLIVDIEGLLRAINSRTVTKNTDSHDVKKAISQQMVLGYRVDDLNTILRRMAKEREEQAAAEDTEGAAFADQIPSLISGVIRPLSIHEHLRNSDCTVRARAAEAEAIEPSQRTSEQQQLLADITTLGRFSDSTSYQDVYTPEELHKLVVDLEHLSAKNRPDFDGIEGKLLDLIAESARREASERTDRLQGVLEREAQDSPYRKGMQWNTLIEVAMLASKYIAHLNEGRKYGVDMAGYAISLHDPLPQRYPDLSLVYQAVADMYVMDVIGQRSLKVDGPNQEIFRSNCQKINDWYEQVDSVLSQLPGRLEVRKLRDHLKELIALMNIRLQGGESAGYKKDYTFNPTGAIKLQLRIAHTVERLKEQLTSKEPLVDEGEIIPLDE